MLQYGLEDLRKEKKTQKDVRDGVSPVCMKKIHQAMKVFGASIGFSGQCRQMCSQECVGKIGALMRKTP